MGFILQCVALPPTLVGITEAGQSLDQDLTPISLLVLSPVMQRHQTRRHDEVELCTGNGPETSPIGWCFLFHEHGGRIDASDGTKSNLQTRRDPEKIRLWRDEMPE